jgi:hypothetical protein
MPPIEISGKPYEDSPKDIIGAFLVIPLNEQPPDPWILHFKNPVAVPANIPAATFVDGTFRMPIIGGIRRSVGVYLADVQRAIAEANARFDERSAESAEVQERSQHQARLAKEKFDGDLADWWVENEPPTIA